ncbi:hypothetical protein NFJ02_22g50070 [Pycnococcus provasolii]
MLAANTTLVLVDARPMLAALLEATAGETQLRRASSQQQQQSHQQAGAGGHSQPSPHKRARDHDSSAERLSAAKSAVRTICAAFSHEVARKQLRKSVAPESAYDQERKKNKQLSPLKVRWAYRIYVSGLSLQRGNRLLRSLLGYGAQNVNPDPVERPDLDANDGKSVRELCQRLYKLAHARVPTEYSIDLNQASASLSSSSACIRTANIAWKGLQATAAASVAPNSTGCILIVAPGPRGGAEAAGASEEDANAALSQLVKDGYVVTWIDAGSMPASEESAAAPHALSCALRRHGGAYRPLAWVDAARRRGIAWPQLLCEESSGEGACNNTAPAIMLATSQPATRHDEDSATPPTDDSPTPDTDRIDDDGDEFSTLLRRCAAPTRRLPTTRPVSAHDLWPIMMQLQKQARKPSDGGDSVWRRACTSLQNLVNHASTPPADDRPIADAGCERDATERSGEPQAATTRRLFELCCERIVGTHVAYVCDGLPAPPPPMTSSESTGKELDSQLRDAVGAPLECTASLEQRSNVSSGPWLNGSMQAAMDIMRALSAVVAAVASTHDDSLATSKNLQIDLLRDLGVWVDMENKRAMDEQIDLQTKRVDGIAVNLAESNREGNITPDVFATLSSESLVTRARDLLDGGSGVANEITRRAITVNTSEPPTDSIAEMLRKARACALQLSLRLMLSMSPSFDGAQIEIEYKDCKMLHRQLNTYVPMGYFLDKWHKSLQDAFEQVKAETRSGRLPGPQPPFILKLLKSEDFLTPEEFKRLKSSKVSNDTTEQRLQRCEDTGAGAGAISAVAVAPMPVSTAPDGSRQAVRRRSSPARANQPQTALQHDVLRRQTSMRSIARARGPVVLTTRQNNTSKRKRSSENQGASDAVNGKRHQSQPVANGGAWMVRKTKKTPKTGAMVLEDFGICFTPSDGPNPPAATAAGRMTSRIHLPEPGLPRERRRSLLPDLVRETPVRN